MLARVRGVNNAIFITGSKVGTQMFYGHGAGGNATGAVVVSDLIEIARDLVQGHLRAKSAVGFVDSPQLKLCEDPRPVRWYLGLNVKDQRGVVALVAEVIARYDIHLESLGQEPRVSSDELSLSITLEPVSEPLICRAVDEINALDFMVRPLLLLRIE